MKSLNTLLLVEDEKEQAEMLAEYLESHNYEVLVAQTGDEALELIDRHAGSIRLAALDMVLEGMGGRELCRYIRNHEVLHAIPVMFITAKDSETDEIGALEAGADAYITKPASLDLIKTRMEVLLRNANSANTNWVQYGDLVMNLNVSDFYINGEPVTLTPSEFEMIKLFFKNPGKVFSRQQILSNIFSDSHFVFDRTVDTHVKNIRHKLGHYSKIIRTHHGSGYGLAL